MPRDAQALQECVRGTDVFARAYPQHKPRLVKAIQANGLFFAMTGDGVNDAPAPHRADVGVAMGIKGTQVTREAAEMILADDNFASISASVKEGRSVYNNIEKALLFMLPTNAGQGAVIAAAILFGFALPITAPQILWVNMVTSVALGLVISFEPHEAVDASPYRQPRALARHPVDDGAAAVVHLRAPPAGYVRYHGIAHRCLDETAGGCGSAPSRRGGRKIGRQVCPRLAMRGAPPDKERFAAASPGLTR
ncbi:HAD-IC family P-type ATPase [Bordetella ansorpii]